MWQLAVDLGAFRTVVALARDGAPAQLVQIDNGLTLPSGLYVEHDGRLLVGAHAQERGERHPERYEPYPTLRIPETNLLLGEHVVPVVDGITVLLRHIAEEVHRRIGAQPAQVLLSTPAYWSAMEVHALQEAAARVWGFGVAHTVPGVQAAGAYCAEQSTMPLGYPFAVYDLGAGGFSGAVLRAEAHRVRVLASTGASGVGGVAADAALLRHLDQQLAGRDQAPWSDLRHLHHEVRQAREQLSSTTEAALVLSSPFDTVRLSRDELQSLLLPPLEHTVRLLGDAVTEAGLHPDGLFGVFLLGGVSATPMVAELIGRHFRILPVDPEGAVALGAHLSASAPVPPAVDPPGAAPTVAVLPTSHWEPRTAAGTATPAGTAHPVGSAPPAGTPPPDGAGAPAGTDPPADGGVPSKRTGSGSGRALAMVGAAAVVVVILFFGVTLTALNTGSSQTDTTAITTLEAAPPGPSRLRVPAPTTEPPTPSSVTPPAPVVPGWQTVAVPSRGAAYDVPPGWKVSSQGTIGGFENKFRPPVVGKGLATFGSNFCDPYDDKAVTAMSGSGQAEPALGARELATQWAKIAFANATTGTVPPLQVGAPQTVPSRTGKTGTLVEVTAQLEKKQACSVPSASMYAFALPSTRGGSVALLVYVAHDVPETVGSDVVRQIMGSVRKL